MFRKKWAAVAILFTITLTATACSSDNPENKETAEHAPADKIDDQQKEVPKDNRVWLPQEQLQKTDQGQAVTALQEALNKAGYTIDSSGKYDDHTTWAITDFQLHQETLTVTGVYDKATRKALQKALKENAAIEVGAALDKPDNKPETVDNPHDILVLVNKENKLPDNFVPKNLTVPDVRFPYEGFYQKMQMRKVAARALEDMFQAADNAGIELFAQSGYRSFKRQDAIFASNVRKQGEEAANKVSARPGESEHQTGLTMDVTSRDIGFHLTEEFGKTDEGKWVKKHAADYGFIIRYPKGKQAITKYQYEPWHLRYVGKKAATAIMEQGITLEEYLGEV
ncbi:carboxypeptidase [Lentibacillus lipolyticus]|nr:carboxypeptidase [Lentibacillus lipolyticus]